MNIDFNCSIDSNEQGNSSDSEFKDILNEFKDKKKSTISIKKIKASDRSRRRLKESKKIINSNSFIISYTELLAELSKVKSNELESSDPKATKLKVEKKVESINLNNYSSTNPYFFMVYFFDEHTIDNSVHHINLHKLTSINKIFPLKRYFLNRKNLLVESLNFDGVMVNHEHIGIRKSRHYQIYFKGNRYFFELDSHGISNINEEKNECS